MILGIAKACEKDVWQHSLMKNSAAEECSPYKLVDDELVGGNHPQADKFKVFFDWLIKGGSQCPKLFLRYYSENYRAVNAKCDIASNEDILFVPHNLLMTSEAAKESEIGVAILKSKVQLRSRHSMLAAFLLQEKRRPNSYWRPYLDVLPENYDTVPLFFNSEQLLQLDGSMSIQKTRERHETLRFEYDNICRHLPSFKQYPYEDFMWARLVVITRIFGMHIDGVKTEGLVPMADLLNHKRPRQTKWTYNQGRRGFVITSLQPIGTQLEVFDSYGRKCNSRFFVNYGFVPENNEDNEAQMSFSLSTEDPAFAQKSRLVSDPNMLDQERTFQIPIQYNDPNSKVKECFSYLRFLLATPEELTTFCARETFVLNDVRPMTAANEKRVLQGLLMAARSSLSKFPDTLEHDLKLLENHVQYPRFANARNIILMRSGEKRVLHHFGALAETCIPLLSMTQSQVRDFVRRRRPSADIEYYIREVVLKLIS